MDVNVNGRTHTVDVDPETPLLYVLRNDLGLNGPKFGCGLSQCGACEVIMNGREIRSCVTSVSAAIGAEVVTLEGLGTEANPHPLQQAFIDEQAAQCGYCINGMIITAKAFLDRNPNADEAAIRQALSRNLCRCATHLRIMGAVNRYARGLQAWARTMWRAYPRLSQSLVAGDRRLIAKAGRSRGGRYSKVPARS